MTLIFLNLETMLQFDGSKFIVERPTTTTSKANRQFQPEVPADIGSKGITTPRQRGRPSGSRVIESTDEDEDVAPFETPRVLKKTKTRVEPASEIEAISDMEKNKAKSVKKMKGQNKGKNNNTVC